VLFLVLIRRNHISLQKINHPKNDYLFVLFINILCVFYDWCESYAKSLLFVNKKCYAEGATQFYECCVALLRFAHVDVLALSSSLYRLYTWICEANLYLCWWPGTHDTRFFSGLSLPGLLTPGSWFLIPDSQHIMCPI